MHLSLPKVSSLTDWPCCQRRNYHHSRLFLSILGFLLSLFFSLRIFVLPHFLVLCLCVCKVAGEGQGGGGGGGREGLKNKKLSTFQIVIFIVRTCHLLLVVVLSYSVLAERRKADESGAVKKMKDVRIQSEAVTVFRAAAPSCCRRGFAPRGLFCLPQDFLLPAD